MAVGVVTAKSSGLSPIWVTVLLSLAVLLILGLAVPALFGAAREWWFTWSRSRRLHACWKPFRHEVDERRWLFAHMHAHSLTSLLGALRTAPADEETRVRLRVLQFAIASCASLDGIRQSLDQLVEAPWSGDSSARAAIGMFESLIAFPDSAGWMRELNALSASTTDGPLVEEWLERYRSSLGQYGRWARDRNRELGVKVFREHFL